MDELYNGRFSFSELAKHRPMLFDTSSLADWIYGRDGVVGVGDFNGKREIRSADFFRTKSLEHPGKMVIPEGVATEYLGGNDFIMAKRRSLIQGIFSYGGIVKFNEREEAAYRRFLMGNEVYLKRLGQTDFDVAACAIILGMMREPYFLITNDKEMAGFTVRVSRRLRMNRNDLCCLTRWNFDEYGDPFK